MTVALVLVVLGLTGCTNNSFTRLGFPNPITEQGKTTLTLTVLYPSKEARDGAIASGMERGVAAGYDRLDEILAATLARGN